MSPERRNGTGANWATVAATNQAMLTAWDAYQAVNVVPPLQVDQMNRALTALAGDRLVPAANQQNGEGNANAALDVGQVALDLQLQFRQPVEVERERFELWTRHDVATLEWLLQRFGHTLDSAVLAEIQRCLADLRVAADEEDTEAAGIGLAPQLLDAVDTLS